MSTVNENSIIEKIVFDVTIEDKLHKGVTLDYTENEELDIPEECKDDDYEPWGLRLCELHYEDNDSWNAIEIDGEPYDFQIFSFGDMKTYTKTGGYDDKKVMKLPLHCQINCMEIDGECWTHTDYWIYDAKFENVKVYTKDGVVEVKINEK